MSERNIWYDLKAPQQVYNNFYRDKRSSSESFVVNDVAFELWRKGTLRRLLEQIVNKQQLVTMRNELLLPLLEFFNFDDKRKTHTVHTNQTEKKT